MRTVRLIGLIGVGGSGKAFVAQRLVNVYGFTALSFTDPIRDMLSAGFGLTEQDFDNRAKKLPLARFGGHNVSNLLRTLNHDWGRGRIHSDIWCNEFRRRFAATDGMVVADDLQWENQVNTIREEGGLVVRVRRPNYATHDTDAAERQSWLVHDIELVNDGLGELCKLVDRLVEGLADTGALAAR